MISHMPAITRRDGLVRGECGGLVRFVDTEEHFDTALCRLLGLEQYAADRFVLRWLEISSESGSKDAPVPLDVILSEIAAAWSSVSSRVDASRALPGEEITLAGQSLSADHLWASAIADADDFMMVGTAAAPFSHAWLVHAETGKRAGTPLYEEDYFEGEIERVGYGSYAEQAGWRIEKGRRQTRQVQAVMRWVDLQPTRCRILDVGCGYGYFRHGVDELGWLHDGLEVSDFAAVASREMFGFDTQVGELSDVRRPSAGYDVIVMWDFIEHVADPDASLGIARDLLRDGGLLFIRTPNLLAAERIVFGSDYHSLKLEHLHMFAPSSLAAALVAAGLEPVVTETEAHLLRGFLGARTAELAAMQRGSDFFVAARRV